MCYSVWLMFSFSLFFLSLLFSFFGHVVCVCMYDVSCACMSRVWQDRKENVYGPFPAKQLVEAHNAGYINDRKVLIKEARMRGDFRPIGSQALMHGPPRDEAFKSLSTWPQVMKRTRVYFPALFIFYSPRFYSSECSCFLSTLGVYVYCVRTTGALGGQLMCDDEPIHQFINETL